MVMPTPVFPMNVFALLVPRSLEPARDSRSGIALLVLVVVARVDGLRVRELCLHQWSFSSTLIPASLIVVSILQFDVVNHRHCRHPFVVVVSVVLLVHVLSLVLLSFPEQSVTAIPIPLAPHRRLLTSYLL